LNESIVALFSAIGGKRKYPINDYITAIVATCGMVLYNFEEVIPSIIIDGRNKWRR